MNDELPMGNDCRPSPSAVRANPPQRILMVDDDVLMCRFNCGILVQSGYEVHAAADGADGWGALQAYHFDLVITDNSMPKVTGVEMVKMLRDRDKTLPVILASGAVPRKELTLHPELKINAILLKPYTVKELLAAVTSVLGVINGSKA